MKFLENYFPMFMQLQYLTIEEYKVSYESQVNKALLNLEGKEEDKIIDGLVEAHQMIKFFYHEQYKVFGREAYFMFDFISLSNRVSFYLVKVNSKEKDKK